MEDPKSWGLIVVTVLGIVSAVVAWAVGSQKFRREASDNKLNETLNTVAGVHVNGLLEELEAVRAKCAEHEQEAKVNYQLFIAEQRRADLKDLQVRANTFEIERLGRQVTELTQVLLKYRPEERHALSKSGFVPLEGLK